LFNALDSMPTKGAEGVQTFYQGNISMIGCLLFIPCEAVENEGEERGVCRRYPMGKIVVRLPRWVA
jgi:hypothetical protein